MPRHPPVSRYRFAVDPDGPTDRPARQPRIPGVPLDADDDRYVEPFNPAIVARAAAGDRVCLVHRIAGECPLCLAVEVDLVSVRRPARQGAA